MTTLYLIRGIPGSGKSTLAQQLVDSGLAKSRLEADMYFIDQTGNYKFDGSKLGHAHSWCQVEAERRLSRGESVVVSNTCTTEYEVDIYARIVERVGAKFVSLVVETRHDGKNQHNVPAEKIQQMKDRFTVKL